MKIDIISDLHLDMWMSNTLQGKKLDRVLHNFIHNICNITKNNDYETLIIAGDLSHNNKLTKEFLIKIKKIFKTVLLVPGNHDMYLLSNNQIDKYKSSENRLQEIKKICEDTDVIYLDKVYEIQGIKFGGTIGWYHLKDTLDYRNWKRVMNDANHIYSGTERKAFQTQGMYGSYGAYTLKSNWDVFKFYEDQLEIMEKIAEEKCDILVNHISQVLPPNEVIDKRYINSSYNNFYYVDNFDVVKKSGCKYYIYGHTHTKQSWKQDGIQMICNPLGYPGETYGCKLERIEL